MCGEGREGEERRGEEGRGEETRGDERRDVPIPHLCKQLATVSPPMPPPTTITFFVALLISLFFTQFFCFFFFFVLFDFFSHLMISPKTNIYKRRGRYLHVIMYAGNLGQIWPTRARHY